MPTKDDEERDRKRWFESFNEKRLARIESVLESLKDDAAGVKPFFDKLGPAYAYQLIENVTIAPRRWFFPRIAPKPYAKANRRLARNIRAVLDALDVEPTTWANGAKTHSMGRYDGFGDAVLGSETIAALKAVAEAADEHVARAKKDRSPPGPPPNPTAFYIALELSEAWRRGGLPGRGLYWDPTRGRCEGPLAQLARILLPDKPEAVKAALERLRPSNKEGNSGKRGG